MPFKKPFKEKSKPKRTDENIPMSGSGSIVDPYQFHPFATASEIILNLFVDDMLASIEDGHIQYFVYKDILLGILMTTGSSTSKNYHIDNHKNILVSKRIFYSGSGIGLDIIESTLNIVFPNTESNIDNIVDSEFGDINRLSNEFTLTHLESLANQEAKRQGKPTPFLPPLGKGEISDPFAVTGTSTDYIINLLIRNAAFRYLLRNKPLVFFRVFNYVFGLMRTDYLSGEAKEINKAFNLDADIVMVPRLKLKLSLAENPKDIDAESIDYALYTPILRDKSYDITDREKILVRMNTVGDQNHLHKVISEMASHLNFEWIHAPDAAES